MVPRARELTTQATHPSLSILAGRFRGEDRADRSRSIRSWPATAALNWHGMVPTARQVQGSVLPIRAALARVAALARPCPWTL